jgi:formylglycine-generating enzyme
MKDRNTIGIGAVMLIAAAMLVAAPAARAGLTGYVTIGDAGNANDGTTGRGGVDYEYQIMQNETTVAQWDAFYNDADSGKVGTFNSAYDGWTDGSIDANISLGDDSPVVNVSTYQAAQYANWLTSGDATVGVYTIGANGAVTAINRDYRNADGVMYALPTENEWYKAAYYSLEDDVYYATAMGNNNTVPQATAETEAEYNALDSGWNYGLGITYNSDSSQPWEVGKGSQEENLTYDMMGNVWEWTEDFSGVARGGTYNTPLDRTHLLRSFRATADGPTVEGPSKGFRLVAIPEPASALTLVLGGLVVAVLRHLRRGYGL